eukprot:3705832-Rhodomonas_salina.1
MDKRVAAGGRRAPMTWPISSIATLAPLTSVTRMLPSCSTSMKSSASSDSYTKLPSPKHIQSASEPRPTERAHADSSHDALQRDSDATRRRGLRTHSGAFREDRRAPALGEEHGLAGPVHVELQLHVLRLNHCLVRSAVPLLWQYPPEKRGMGAAAGGSVGGAPGHAGCRGRQRWRGALPA